MKKFIALTVILMMVVTESACETVPSATKSSESLASLTGDVPELGQKIHVLEIIVKESKNGHRKYFLLWEMVGETEIHVAKLSGRTLAKNLEFSPDQVYVIARDKENGGLYFKLLPALEK